jgi:hypothetical protein
MDENKFIKDHEGVIADTFALPFWAILLIYAFYKIAHGDTSAWVIVFIIGGASVIDSMLVVKFWGKKK